MQQEKNTQEGGSPSDGMETIRHEDGRGRSLLVAIALTVAGVVTAEFMTIPAVLADPALVTAPAEASRDVVLAFMVLNFLGFFVAGGAYLLYAGKGWSYLDLRLPSLREWGYVVASVLASIAILILINVVVSVLDLPATDNQVIQFVGDDPTMVLLLLVVVFLFNAPAEEFLFRNVIQKRLYAAFTRIGAVLVTSLIFAVVHVPAFLMAADGTIAEPLAIAVSITVVFLGSVIFGYVYAKTDNLVVPIAGHAAFNAFQLGLLYIALVYGDPEDLEATTSFVVEFVLVIL